MKLVREDFIIAFVKMVYKDENVTNYKHGIKLSKSLTILEVLGKMKLQQLV